MAQKGFEFDKKVLFRRLVALPLVVFLAFLPAVPLVQATDPVTAASLAITGGQLAGAGLSGEAALSLAGPVGAVVGVTLGALGLNAYVSRAAQEAGKTRTRFVLDKLVLWGAMAGYSQEQLYTKIAEGISVAADGTIQLTKDVSNFIAQFGNWAVTQDFTVPNTSTGVADSVTFDNVSYPLYTSGTYIDSNGTNWTWVSTVPVVSVMWQVPRSWIHGYITLEQGQLVEFNSETGAFNNLYLGISRQTSAGQTLWYAFKDIDTTPQRATNISYLGSIDGFYGSISGTGAYDVPAAADEVFTGTPESWAQNRDVLNPAGDTPVTLNPDLLNPIIDSLADGKQATMSIIDYLQALQDAWDHALDDVQTAIGTITDTLTGIQESIAVPDTATRNPTVTNPSVTPETTPVLDPSEVDPGTVITGFQFDLAEIFPFCLPFDVYKMLRLLDAQPVAPSYRFQFDVPIPGLPGHSVGSWHFDYTIDLAQFNTVAVLLRKLELLSFCIGLAYVTRSMFIRS